MKTIDNKEGPALGVAILAGVGVGLFSSVPEACDSLIHDKSVQEPIRANSDVYDKYYPLYQKLYTDLKDSFNELATL